MPTRNRLAPFVSSLALIVSPVATFAQKAPLLHAPAVDEFPQHRPEGLTILSNGRLLKPEGRHFPVSKWPHGLTLSPDGRTLFIASEGVGQFVKDWTGTTPQVTSFLPTEGKKKRTNAGGAAFSQSGKTLYWSSGESGEIYAVDVESQKVTSEISLNTVLNGRKYEDSYAMDLKLSEDGAFLYAADVTNFRVAVVEISTQKVIGSVDVGRYPYALTVSGTRVFVANIGMFEYSAILPPKEKSQKNDPRGLTFPAFGFPSKEARDGVESEGRNVPGLGDPNVPESFSVWGIDAAKPDSPKITLKIKTGLLVGAPSDKGKTVGGSAPNFLAVKGDVLYVSNGNNDTIERINLKTGKIETRVKIQPSPLTKTLRGVAPSGMALSLDGSRLYIAESGINAIGVLDTKLGKMIGHIPAGWYPYRVALSEDGKNLACINFRGFGNGPNAGKEMPKSPYLGMKGMVNVLSVPTDAQLSVMTRNVLHYNGMEDRRKEAEQKETGRNKIVASSRVIPNVPGKVSDEIKYVVFITKENHTFDAIFDRVPGSNNDPNLLRWGDHQTIAAAGQPTLNDVAVMTNHNALARQFGLSDNFYMEPEASGVGHRWLVGVQPNNFCQMTYTLGWDFKLKSTAPGRRASFGSNGSIAPEDYPEAGAMWEHLAGHGIPFRNYGEGFEFAGVLEDDNEHKTGAREVINIPMSKVLFDQTCREFPIFNMNIPDQYRADWLIKDYTRLYLDGKNPVPPFLNIAICNDHGAAPNAKKGYPYVASWMADNDLALGRIIEFLTHTPQWKHMAIFVTQDDAGGEPDHVDAQRSVLLAISPYIRRGFVSHRLTTIVSLHRTLYQILGLPPLNLFDALANDFSDFFTSTPDFTPYSAVSVDARIFDPKKAIDPNDPDYRLALNTRSILRDDPDEEEEILKASP
ncbi:MAG: bifunctional YncE family protein/alkaline phosphatase family protein [Chthonomonadaceae bacterium]|nr:bifunctional YncE family protein/alkaline phosphatase family protein [Chthonomonadaceae bacterium]